MVGHRVVVMPLPSNNSIHDMVVDPGMVAKVLTEELGAQWPEEPQLYSYWDLQHIT